MASKNKNRIAFILIACIFILCAAWLVFADRLMPSGTTAEISVDGEVVITLDLGRAKNETISLENYGKNVILEVENGAIRFVSSDCPDKVCINTGFVKNEIQTAVCLPNKTAVVILSE